MPYVPTCWILARWLMTKLGILQLQVRCCSPIVTIDLTLRRGYANSNGWSAVGGQTQSAYLPLAPNEIFLGQSV
jgi:hypothetical protein